MAKVTVYMRFRSATMLLLATLMMGQVAGQYPLRVRISDEERPLLAGAIRIPEQFSSRAECMKFIEQLPGKLHRQGFAAASVDRMDFEKDGGEILVYLGKKFNIGQIRYDASLGKEILAAGLGNLMQEDVPLEPSRWKSIREKLLLYYEENGYPFASIGLDSVLLENGRLEGQLVVKHGPLYKIDSVSNQGTAAISPRFLHRYLGILPGSHYKRTALEQISKKLSDLSFLEETNPWTLTRLGTGGVVNVYLEPKKSSQANVLVGLLPAAEAPNNIYEPQRNRFQLTGEANIKLRNAFGSGEVIGLNWQQLQLRSPRLNLLYEQPYVAGSTFGIQFNFDLFKKDTSFLNLNGLIGVTYGASSRSRGTLFLQLQKSNLLSIDTIGVKEQKLLPSSGDLRAVSMGISYEFNSTDFRTNPLKGSEVLVLVSAGTKTLKKNDAVTGLSDQNDPSFQFASLYDSVRSHTYQFRLKAYGAHFFRISKASTFKAALHAGWFQSPSIFRNELFQIGGYRLLRGFDEESIYASKYGVATLEYRYLFGRNSHFFVFSDLGLVRNAALAANSSHSFWGGGVGMMLETKSGLLNISLAAGKRNDLDFNLRQSKIHLGYVSYF